MLSRAGAAGHLAAQYALGMLLHSGYGETARNPEEVGAASTNHKAARLRC